MKIKDEKLQKYIRVKDNAAIEKENIEKILEKKIFGIEQ